MSFIHSTNDFKSFYRFSEIIMWIIKTAMKQKLLCLWCVLVPFQVTCSALSLANRLFYQIKMVTLHYIKSHKNLDVISICHFRQDNWTTFLKLIEFKGFHTLFLGCGTIETTYKSIFFKFFLHRRTWNAIICWDIVELSKWYSRNFYKEPRITYMLEKSDSIQIPQWASFMQLKEHLHFRVFSKINLEHHSHGQRETS